MRMIRIKVGMWLRKLGRFAQPDYYVCTRCGYIEYKQLNVRCRAGKPTLCWECEDGEMIFRGDF